MQNIEVGSAKALEMLRNIDVQNALQDPFARFVFLTVFRIRKIWKGIVIRLKKGGD